MTESAPPETGRRHLARVLGPSTTLLVGVGVALGSGILRTPPLVAASLGSPVLILSAWVLGGFVILASSLVMAELATRLPESGGEYAWLREAYGPFVAFFFGWGYTIFVVGGGSATIAAAFGDAAVQLGGDGLLPARGWAGLAVVVVAAANMYGLRTGALLQNGLTVLKVLLVLAIATLALGLAPESQTSPRLPWPSATAWISALPPVIWAYTGSTDAVKLAGEVKDPARTLPRALLGATGLLMVVYVFVNAALLYALGSEGLARSTLPAADVARQMLGEMGGAWVAAGSAIIFLGALSSTMLATVRVAWALGQDGFGFDALGEMNSRQSPVGALALAGGIALIFALGRDFEQILGIYFLATAILFGLVYASLLVFRAREQGPAPAGVFVCPVPVVWVTGLVLIQGSMAALVVVNAPGDALATLGLLAVVALAYRVVKRRHPESIA